MDTSKIWLNYNEKTYRQNSRCLAVNTILAGKYLIGPVLGQGGFGITYQGYDLNMETRIAVKEYFPVELVSRDTTTMHGDHVLSLGGEKSVTYQQGLKKYVAEAQNVSQFSETPGVVSVKDFFYENETAYIVMEYIEGKSLKDYLKERGGRLPEEEALAILKPVIEALIEVHKAGIIHRDLSPDNIMLTFEAEGEAAGGGNGAPARAAGAGRGGNGAPVRTESIAAAGSAAGPGSKAAPGTPSRSIRSVKLIDFGAARMTAKNDQKSLTIILKHGYAPEEQYRTRGEQGPWTDVYAVCAVLYRMLTGETPVPAMDRLFSDALKPVEAFGGKVSGQTAAAVLKGLAVKKEDRISSMEELYGALYERKAVSGDRKKRRENSGGRRVSGTAAQKKAAVVIVAAAVIAVFIAAAGVVALNGKREKAGAALSDGGIAAGTQTGNGQSEAGAISGESESSQAADSRTEGKNGQQTGVSVSMEETDDLGEAIVFPSAQTAVSSSMGRHTLIRLPDGMVKAIGSNEYGQCMVENWHDIVAVAAGNNHSLGLRSDGKVFAAGLDTDGQCAVEGWTNVVQIATGNSVSLGVTADGTVLVAGADGNGWLEQVAEWKDVVAIACGMYGDIAGLDKAGNILHVGGEEWPDISGWQGVTHLAYRGSALLGLKEDGTVLKAQLDDSEWLYAGVEDWTDLKQISANLPVMGVKQDGIIQMEEGTQDVQPWEITMREALAKWTNLEAVSSIAGVDRIYVVGLQTDGNVLEYQYTYGNAVLEDMKNLEAVWPLEINGYTNLAAKTKEGRLLTYGLETIRLNDLANLNVSGAIPAAQITGLVGQDALLLEDGRLVYYGNFMEGKENQTFAEQVKEAVELWEYTNKSYGYAVLHENGQVELKILEASGEKPEYIEWLKERFSEISQWSDVVQLTGWESDLYGLKADGTVIGAGEGEIAEGITRLASWEEEALGIREDGTAAVLCTNQYAEAFGRTQVTAWSDLQDIAMGQSHVVGLKTDGTVLAAGSNHAGQCEVEDWTDIVYLTAGKNCTLGITADGELRLAGSLY